MKKAYIVEITSCSNPMYWYHNQIRKRFECILKISDSMLWPSDILFTTIMPLGAPFPQRCNILPNDCKVISERLIEGGKLECQTCHGAGQVQQTDIDWDDCRICNGTGKINF